VQALAEGTIFASRYRIKRRVASTRSSVVYQAAHCDLDRLGAIKIKRASGANSGLSVVQEGRILASLHDPGVVSVYDCGLVDNRGYLITEWAHGETVASLIDRGALTSPRAINITASIAHTLHKVHTQGFVHRDVKPSNVIVLTSTGNNDCAIKLIDFGVARALDHINNGTRKSAQWGRVSGTLAYMAPEQLTGRRESIATDIYALGVCLFEMIFGSTPMPVTSENAQAIGIPSESAPFLFGGEVVVRKLLEEPVIPTIDGKMTTINSLLTYMLRRDPNDRPATMHEVGECLDAIALAPSL
jgi:serine/threonine protein kinase